MIKRTKQQLSKNVRGSNPNIADLFGGTLWGPIHCKFQCLVCWSFRARALVAMTGDLTNTYICQVNHKDFPLNHRSWYSILWNGRPLKLGQALSNKTRSKMETKWPRVTPLKRLDRNILDCLRILTSRCVSAVQIDQLCSDTLWSR